MAVDWWLLNNLQKAVFRLYSWSEPTLSLGYRQQFNPPSDFEKLAESFPVVVRPTGGGYLLHAGEITFSLLIPSGHKLSARSIPEVYEFTCGCFSRALNGAGIENQPVTVEESTRGEISASCLASPGSHEPVIDGKKWMAAAQVRHRGAILEQGSIFWGEEEWPAEHRLDTPRFISENIEISRREFIKKLLTEVNNDLLDNVPEFRKLTEKEWGQIKNLADEFEVRKLSQLPVFSRT